MNNDNHTESLHDWVPCPSCGCYAYWDGSVYFCDQCGWSGDIDDVRNMSKEMTAGGM